MFPYIPKQKTKLLLCVFIFRLNKVVWKTKHWSPRLQIQTNIFNKKPRHSTREGCCIVVVGGGSGRKVGRRRQPCTAFVQHAKVSDERHSVSMVSTK